MSHRTHARVSQCCAIYRKKHVNVLQFSSAFLSLVHTHINTHTHMHAHTNTNTHTHKKTTHTHTHTQITREREVHKREEAIQHFRALMSDMVRTHTRTHTHTHAHTPPFPRSFT